MKLSSGRLMSYTEQYLEYDPFVSPLEPSNPWIGDDTTFWDMEARFDSFTPTTLYKASGSGQFR